MRYGSLVDDKVNEGEKGPVTDSVVDETLPAKIVEAKTTAKRLAKKAKEKAEEAAAGFVATAGAVHTAVIVNGLQQQGKGNNEELDSKQVKQNLREQDAPREQLEQLALKRQEMAEQAKAARRALQVAKAKALKSQKAATAFAAQRREIDEHLGQADVKPTERATEQTSESSRKGATGENHGGDDMSASNDVDMGASLRLDDLDERTLPSLPIPGGILNATDGFTLDELRKQEPKLSETLPEPIEETLREKPTCLEPNLELQSLMKVAQAKSDEAKNIRQGQRDRNDHEKTLDATRIRTARLDQPSTNESGTRGTGHREIVSTRKNSKTSIQNNFPNANKTTAKNEHLLSSQPVVIGILRGNQASSLLTDWLKQHSLNVIDVPVNGNCLFGVLFAAMSGFLGPGKMEYSDCVEKEAQVWKSRILAFCQEYVMLEAAGGAMRLPNDRQTLKQLYPSEEWVASEDSTRIMNRLIRHYAEWEIFKFETWLHTYSGDEQPSCMLRQVFYEYQFTSLKPTTQDIFRPGDIATRTRPRDNIEFCQLCSFTEGDGRWRPFPGTQIRGSPLPRLLSSETTDVHPNMRERLDDVHSILNMPPVVAIPQWEFDLQEDEEGHEAAQQLMSTSQDGKTVKDRGKTWTNEDQERRKRMMQANLTKLKEWTASGRIIGLKMEVSKFWDLKTLSVSNEAVFGHLKQLFYSLPYPELAIQVIGNKCLTNWGVHIAVRAQVDYLHRLDAHLKKQEDKQFIKEWKRQKAKVPTALSGHAHLGLDKSKWALASFLPYIIFSWRPICGVDPAPKNWRPAIKVGIKLTQQKDVGPTWPSLESNDSSQGHARC
ncbi:hypothetical protein Plhal703r1_c53g0159011 [Plasmopara halstedii]